MASTSKLCEEGPVSFIKKRKRSCEKKLRSILEKEKSGDQGKTLNEDEKKLLKSKSSVEGAIAELNKLLELLETLPKVDVETVSDTIESLVKVLYFGNLFDRTSNNAGTERALLSKHDKSNITDMDFDLISMLGRLIVSRPVNSPLSHKHALEKCIEHAKLWIEKSEQRIEAKSDATYAGLRAKLDKIIGSLYSISKLSKEGPVSIIKKRKRACEKKLRSILETEKSRDQGKTLNKDQKELLKSKPSVEGAIAEYKLLEPLANVDEETVSDTIERLVKVLYFGNLSDGTSNDAMKERGLWLSMTPDDDKSSINLMDFDLISMLGRLIVSRPVNSPLSHKHALEKCIEHAKLWIEKSEQRIEAKSDATYAGLRAKLDKVIGSLYFITDTVKVEAAAVTYGSYQVPVEEHVGAAPVDRRGVNIYRSKGFTVYLLYLRSEIHLASLHENLIDCWVYMDFACFYVFFWLDDMLICFNSVIILLQICVFLVICCVSHNFLYIGPRHK